MRDRVLEKWPRLLLTLLLSAGLTLTFFGALGLEVPLGPCLLLMLGMSVMLEGISLTRRSALWGSAALAAAGAFFLLSGSGPALVTDLLRALTLQASGVPGALPLVAPQAALLLTAVLTLLSFLSCRKKAGALPALMLFVGSLVVIWQADRPDLALRLLPAGVSAICLLFLDQHPELSFPRILPWTAAVFLLAAFLTPASGVTVPAWKEKADAFRQAVMDRLFFTEPREVFSLSTEGYYPQGVSQLGGPANPTDHAVMQVSAPRAVYLRGVVMNSYDGRAWRNTLGGRRFLWNASGMSSQRASLFDMNLPSQGLSSSLTAPRNVSVRMLSSGASTLFVPQRVRELRAGGETVPYFTNSSEIFITRNLQPGDTWSVSAPLFTAGDPGLDTLVNAAGSAEDAGYPSILETYTALPSHLEAPVWQLAQEITADYSTPYDQAFAIQNYLSRNYRYTLEAAVHPANQDFVTAFLFSGREGYCTYFASAMTVLCRMAGLPARYVEGYLAEPGASGEALVTGLNAHAWTEVYFRGFGWLTFDATPRRSGASQDQGGSPDPSAPPSLPPEESPTPPPPGEAEADQPTPPPEEEPEPEAPTPSPDPEAAPPDENSGAPEAGRSAPSGLLWLLLLLLLLAAALLARWLWAAPERKEKRLASEADRFDLWLADVLLRLSSAGHDRTTGETLMAFTRRLDETAALPVRLSRLGECASLLHYGKVQALDTDTVLARDAAAGLKKLPRKARLRYALRRLSFRKAGLGV